MNLAVMCARNGRMRWQFLMRAVGGSGPDITPTPRWFEEWHLRQVSTENTHEGYLVTVEGFLWNLNGGLTALLRDLRQKYGHDNVQVDVVVPDVYGCQIAVRENHVQVNVGPDVINRITQDEQSRDRFLHTAAQGSGTESVAVRYSSTGHITVTRLSRTFDTEITCLLGSAYEVLWGLDWEVRIVSQLIELLSPCEHMFLTDPLAAGDRCLEKCRSRSVCGMPSPDPSNCHFDAVIKRDRNNLSIFKESVFLRKMEETYPGVQFTCDTNHLTLKLSGDGTAVKKTTEDIFSHVKSWSHDTINLTDTEAMMLKRTNAQNWFQQSLDNEGIDCAWELQHASTKGGPKGKKKRLFQQARQPTTVISVTAAESTIPKFRETLMSCFPTTEILLGKSQVSHLESDSWKQMSCRLQTSNGSTISSVLNIQKNRITICDTASNIDITRTAVLEFLFERQMASDPEISQQKVTKTNRKLQPWQVKFLATAQRENQLPECLQQAVSVNIEEEAVHIHAPFHMIHKYSDLLWEYVADLRHEEKQLTAASTQELQSSDSRERVQRLVGEAGVVWDWHVQHERLVVSAHCSHWQQLNEIITSEIETTQSVKMSDAQQQADGQPHENKEQQTDSIHTEDKQIQPETRQEEQETQTEENHMSTEEQHTQSRIRNPQRRWQQTSETDVKTEEGLTQTQTTRPEHKEHQTDESSVEKDSKQGAGFCDQPETQGTPDGDWSITLPKSVVSSQEDRTGDRADTTTSLCDTWPPQHLSGMMEDPLVKVPTSRSDPHSDLLTQSSVPLRNLIQGPNKDVSTEDSEDNDVKITTAYNNSIVSAPSSDEIVSTTEKQPITRHNVYDTNSVPSDRQNILSGATVTDPFLTTFRTANPSQATDSPSLNSVRPSSSSPNLKAEREGRSGWFVPEPTVGTYPLSSSSGDQSADRLCDPANPQDEGRRRPLSRATAAPCGFGDRTQSTVRAPTTPTTTTTTTTTTNNNNSNTSNMHTLRLQLNSVQGRLSMIEQRFSQMEGVEGARENEPRLLDHRMVDMQQQLDQLQQQSHQIQQLLLDLRPQQHDSDSDVAFVCNPSDTSSTSTVLSSF
ncbi:uncharacterized protein LOC143292653 [Babylonia areolata]|uniref:uncharacterized protein LOC143292653 n=1 Tax=Babylonia areolata TaxID=304850 RepID=UPI003FD5F61F